MLDANKTFDRVNYCKLFATLLKRNISPIVLRLLLFMYTHQSLRVKWGSTLSKQFSVMNGVKQGGVLSPILFAVYTDGLLERLKNTDNITLLAPCKSALSILIKVCENYAAEYDIMFNGDKSKLLFFNGRSSVMMPSDIMVNSQIVGVSEKAVHTISTTDRDCITMAAKNKFWKCFNMFIANFELLYCRIKSKLFNQYCCSLYGSPL